MNPASSVDLIYRERYWRLLSPIAVALEELMKNQFRELRHIDRISARAKSPDRFLAKASKQGVDGSMKYSAPLDQIQDQIGARIIVFYTPDVVSVSTAVEQYYRYIERQQIVPDEVSKFGYSGNHYIVALPSDVVPESTNLEDAPEFFELQIKTLWQHAWSEANHDLGYKPSDDLTSDQQRRLAFTAAQAWGADRIFEDLIRESERR